MKSSALALDFFIFLVACFYAASHEAAEIN
jgi:hypothetical protein